MEPSHHLRPHATAGVLMIIGVLLSVLGGAMLAYFGVWGGYSLFFGPGGRAGTTVVTLVVLTLASLFFLVPGIVLFRIGRHMRLTEAEQDPPLQ